MSQSEAVAIVNDKSPDRSRDEVREAWQHLVDNGTVWSMSEWHASMASCLISSGVVERNAA